MDTKRFDEKNLAKHKERCDMIEQLAIAEEESRKLRVELGRAKGTAAGWAKKADKRLGHIDECEAALAKRNERIAELEKQVADLRAELEDTNRMLRESDQLGERERAILDMWPRFEDGEPVWFGDEVDGLGGEIVEVYITENETAIWNSSANHMHLRPGERVKRPAPKVLDADGVEINVGDTVYDAKGEEHIVKEVIFDGDEESPEHTIWFGEYKLGFKFVYVADQLTHTRTDSWEHLEEDALKGVCEYAGAKRRPGTIDAHTCDGCRFDEDGDGPSYEKQMALDIIRRAKALAGVEVD